MLVRGSTRVINLFPYVCFELFLCFVDVIFFRLAIEEVSDIFPEYIQFLFYLKPSKQVETRQYLQLAEFRKYLPQSESGTFFQIFCVLEKQWLIGQTVSNEVQSTAMNFFSLLLNRF